MECTTSTDADALGTVYHAHVAAEDGIYEACRPGLSTNGLNDRGVDGDPRRGTGVARAAARDEYNMDDARRPTAPDLCT
jgi:hypothetical protein